MSNSNKNDYDRRDEPITEVKDNSSEINDTATEGNKNDADEPMNDKEEKITFILGEDKGDYGEEVILNQGTKFEEKEIKFLIPPGEYVVTNNSEAATQIFVYSGGPVC